MILEELLSHDTLLSFSCSFPSTLLHCMMIEVKCLDLQQRPEIK